MSNSFPQRFGPYTLHELVARGGMAEIYRATMPGIGGFEKTVAIKKILPHLAENEEFITMLIDEARIIVSINHFNIAQVYDLGCIDGTYYIAMEFIHGIDLAGMIKILARQNRYVPAEHATYIGSGICAGLHIAHSKADDQGRPLKIVHRDVSPHNVLISYAGDVKIIDFGVAKANSKETNTKMGVIKGKLLYMAPEQAMAKPVDGRSDLFAAGLVMYKMLTNHLPFEGENEFQIYNNILSKEIVAPHVLNPEVPEQLSEIIMKLLARDPEQRYQDGYAAKQALDRVQQALWPGYTVNRLSRFIEDNFSNFRAQSSDKQDISSAAALSPQTPSPVQQHGTGPQMIAQKTDDARDKVLEDVRHTVNLRPPENLARNPAQPPVSGGALPSSLPAPEPFRATISQEITGNNKLPPENPAALDNAMAGLPAPGAKRKTPAPVYPIIGTIFVILALLAYNAFVKPAPEPAPAPENTLARPAPVARPAEPDPFVTVHLDTTPSDAELYREDVFVGITPIILDVERSEKTITYTLRKPGFVERSISVIPDDDISTTIELAADEEAPAVEENLPVAETVKAEPPKIAQPKAEPAKTEPPKVAQPIKAPAKKSEPKVSQSPADKPRKSAPAKKSEPKKDDGGSKPVQILNPFDF